VNYEGPPQKSGKPVTGSDDTGYDISRSKWLKMPPKPDGTPLEDDEIPIPIESPFVTMLRDDLGGPYVFPDSTDWIPPETLAVHDPKLVEDLARKRNAERAREGISSDSVDVPRAQRSLLERSARDDPAAAMLLRTLDRGMETTTAKIDEAVDKRLRRANSLLRFFVREPPAFR
jgi:hypothetical protein